MLEAKGVSAQHAIIQWIGGAWQVQDLGSLNGTFVNKHKLVTGERVSLQGGDAVCFARELGDWRLVDTGPPRPIAMHLLTRRVHVAERGYLALPDGEDPEASVQLSGPDRWVLECDGEVAPIEDRSVVMVRGEPWRVHLPSGVAGTLDERALGPVVTDLRLQFSVAPDEEYVELVAWTDGQRIDLKARAHHYPLLLLARARIADQRAQVPGPQQGWLFQDRILEMLKTDASYLNLSIHRSRHQLSKAGVADAAQLVERRPGTRQLRLGVEAVEIVRL
jgi:hypothetical protein